MRATFNNPFKAKGRWYRGNLHAHSLNSDGSLTPEQLASLYRSCGYDFLSITDHGKLTETEGLSTPRFLLIPGEEICVGTSEASTFFHIVAIDIGEELPVDDFDDHEDPQRVIELIRGLGGEAIVAHPYWSGLTFNDLIGLEGHRGLEVYNANCELTVNRGLSNAHWDDLLSAGSRPLGFAVDDTHGVRRENLPSDSCGGWINVKAEDLAVDHLMASIRGGLFYPSNGPEIKGIRIRDGVISVSTSPARAISFVSNAGLGERHTGVTDLLTEAMYVPRGGERYIRIEVSDEAGRTAWSNPIFITSS